jgi:uncharacterized protein YcaQ
MSIEPVRLTLHELRQYAVARSLFPPTTLAQAIETLGFVQADPIRAPARAQDLTLRHRVEHYVAGDLERLYESLGVDEDTFINYGFVSSAVYALMHPRRSAADWTDRERRRVRELLRFVRTKTSVHPREVDRRFMHGKVTNYWGGSSSATTHLMEHMHYYGLLRVVRREGGIRIYGVSRRGRIPAAVGQPVNLSRAPRVRIDALVDVLVNKYAPLPAASLSYVVSRLRYAVPQWRDELKSALSRARARLAHSRIGNIDWYWPTDENPRVASSPPVVRLLAPFDPIVWDRRRFEILWGWPYRFEAYTPSPKRKLGYYALPMLWGDRVIGWANLAVRNGELRCDAGYAAGRAPRAVAFKRELEAELERMRRFLALRGLEEG